MPVLRSSRSRLTGAAVALLGAVALLTHAFSTPASGATRSLAGQAVGVSSPVPGCHSHGQWLLAGGRCRWQTVLRFEVPDTAIERAVLALRARRAPRAELDVRVVADRSPEGGWSGPGPRAVAGAPARST